MRQQVDHHLSRARAMATASVIGSRSEVAPVLADLQRTLARIYAARELAIEVACPPELAFRGARQDLEEMLGNLLDNACKWAGARVGRARRGGGRAPDGAWSRTTAPGLPPERRSEVMQRGRRLDERVPGSGLGLSIVVDIAELYGGALSLHEARIGRPAGAPRAAGRAKALPTAEPAAERRGSEPNSRRRR